jgi:Mrp family chromosome partitioning ATPase
MDPKNIDYIAELQSPTTAARVTSSRKKIVLGLAGAGFGFGIALALLLELLLDRTVKRPLELETRLDIPLMLAIPRMSRNGRRRLRSGPGPNGNGRSPSTAVARGRAAPWDFGHFIRPFAEVVRDRLAMFFEFNGLHHKPKLVGVAGFSAGAGASTLAGGLAAALSETGDGKVLLVDMNLGQTQAHSFFKGQAAYSLTTAIQSPGRMDSAADNLYLATVNPENDAPVPVGLRKFHAMMPGLKASGYDYIIFDMPHLSQTSPTMAMAAYMDKMLLVVAAETTDRSVVKRRYSELLACKARLSVIFNKARHYGPKWLECET